MYTIGRPVILLCCNHVFSKWIMILTLRWRHNERVCVSNHQLTTVYSTVYSGTHDRKHQSSAVWAFVRRIHQWPVNSLHKWPITRKMFPFDGVIMNSVSQLAFRAFTMYFPMIDDVAYPFLSLASYGNWIQLIELLEPYTANLETEVVSCVRGFFCNFIQHYVLLRIIHKCKRRVDSWHSLVCSCIFLFAKTVMIHRNWFSYFSLCKQRTRWNDHHCKHITPYCCDSNCKNW